jgi:hypothetical protein
MKTKILTNGTLVRSVVTYATETWTMSKNDERRLSIFVRKILGRIKVKYARENSSGRDKLEK